ncbi:MAG TPA: site-specific integrase [Gemmataceae bacterium]|jgi:integrase
MPRRNNTKNGLPWLRKLANGTMRWYLPTSATAGKPTPLVDKNGDFIDGADNEEQAMQAWHEHMTLDQAISGGENDNHPVAVILELYLQHLAEKQAAPKTIDDARWFYELFNKTHPGLIVRELKPKHIRQWWQTKPKWGPSTHRQSAAMIISALNWAEGADGGNMIPKNPLRGMHLPATRSRGAEVVLEPAEYQKVLATAAPDLRDVLIVLYETGTRPSNVTYVEARHCNLERGIWLLDKHKTFRTTGRPLVVPLTPKVVEICRRLMEQHPTGKLFRTKNGLSWTKVNLSARVNFIAKKLGMEGRLMTYSARHSRATHLLESDVPDATVAAILGHANTAMLYKHYGHLGRKIKKLTDILAAHSWEAGSGTETTDSSSPSGDGGDVVVVSEAAPESRSSEAC